MAMCQHRNALMLWYEAYFFSSPPSPRLSSLFTCPFFSLSPLVSPLLLSSPVSFSCLLSQVHNDTPPVFGPSTDADGDFDIQTVNITQVKLVLILVSQVISLEMVDATVVLA
eukprot:754346-Hanusia_phi.AAC.1